MPFRFLDLPGELRNAVYDQVLHPAAFRRHLGDGYTRYDFDLALFRVSRQVYREARDIFLCNFVFVRVETPWDQAQVHIQEEGHVPVLAAGWQANEFRDYHLGLSIEAPSSGIFDRECRTFLILADDLPTFNQLWRYSELTFGEGLGSLNLDLSLTLDVKNPLHPGLELPIAVQRRLFASFGLLKRLKTVRIIGPHSLFLESELQKAMAAPQPTQEECLELATKLKDAGNAELNNNNPAEAINYYLQSFKAIHILCIGRYRAVWADAWFQKTLQGGRYDRQNGQGVRIALRVHLVAKIVKAFLDLENYEEAYFWGDRTIKIIRQVTGNEDDVPMFRFAGAADMGRVLFGTGVAGKHTGRTDEARRLLIAAHRYLPRDEVIKRELSSITCLNAGDCLGN